MKTPRHVFRFRCPDLKLLMSLCLIVLVASSCTLYRIESKDLTTDFYPSKKSASEVVYIENVEQPHEIIGVINIDTERRQRISEVLEKMKREAAILGGDAITNIRTDATGYWKALPAQDFIGNGYVRANFSASIVVFK